jgi:hypothetical protein
MIFIYLVLSVLRVIRLAIQLLLPFLIVTFLNSCYYPIILSSILTPLVTLLPYVLKVFGSVDQLTVQLLQLLNGILALTNSFFVLRITSKIMSLPFTTIIGYLNVVYDLINAILSTVYAVIFAVGSMITGILKVLCIPELIQIPMLVLMLPVLLISFVMQNTL